MAYIFWEWSWDIVFIDEYNWDELNAGLIGLVDIPCPFVGKSPELHVLLLELNFGVLIHHGGLVDHEWNM